MCQKQPGPRCWSDMFSAIRNIGRKLVTARTGVRAAQKAQSDAFGRGDAKGYARATKNLAEAQAAVKIQKQHFDHTRLEIDGTKTGIRNIERQMARTSDPAQLVVLQKRLVHADAHRFERANALALAESGYRPMLKIRGEALAA